MKFLSHIATHPMDPKLICLNSCDNHLFLASSIKVLCKLTLLDIKSHYLDLLLDFHRSHRNYCL